MLHVTVWAQGNTSAHSGNHNNMMTLGWLQVGMRCPGSFIDTDTAKCRVLCLRHFVFGERDSLVLGALAVDRSAGSGGLFRGDRSKPKGVVTVPMSRRLQSSIDASRSAEKWGRLAGLMVLILVVMGLVWISWWVLNHEDMRRFRGIEKFRSGLSIESPYVCASNLGLARYEVPT